MTPVPIFYKHENTSPCLFSPCQAQFYTFQSCAASLPFLLSLKTPTLSACSCKKSIQSHWFNSADYFGCPLSSNTSFFKNVNIQYYRCGHTINWCKGIIMLASIFSDCFLMIPSMEFAFSQLLHIEMTSSLSSLLDFKIISWFITGSSGLSVCISVSVLSW